MNFKKKVSGSWTDVPHYISGTDTETITTLPATIYPLAQSVTIGLKGNTMQNDTPTPDNPTMPQGTGERTGNLFSSVWEQGSIDSTGQNTASDTTIRTKDYIAVNSNAIYSIKRTISTAYINVRFYDSSKNYIGAGAAENYTLIVGSSLSNPMARDVNFCCFEVVNSNIAYMRINDTSNNATTQYMMVQGQYTSATMPDFEPFGYKIPISSANTTTPVYLGEIASTRKIRKLVLTGQENWIMASNNTYRLGNTYALAVALKITSQCSHYRAITNRAALVDMVDKRICINSANGELWIRDSDYSSTTEFNAYLTQQYAAGTPVTVWYVLENETTGIVNEPLMKIGNYADSLSGISIPTTAGANSLDVDTTVAPSEVTANYSGWHPVSAAHERENGAWT